jgi:hypothetical protein
MLPGPGDFRQPTEISFSGWKHCEEIVCLVVCEEIVCLVVAVVAHLIILVSDRILALTRLMAVASALALALILGHLVPL